MPGWRTYNNRKAEKLREASKIGGVKDRHHARNYPVSVGHQVVNFYNKSHLTDWWGKRRTRHHARTHRFLVDRSLDNFVIEEQQFKVSFRASAAFDRYKHHGNVAQIFRDTVALDIPCPWSFTFLYVGDHNYVTGDLLYDIIVSFADETQAVFFKLSK